MNKMQMTDKGRVAPCTSRHFRVSPDSLFLENKGNGVIKRTIAQDMPTIDLRRMAEDASKMQAYIAKGGKKADPRDTIIKPSGLFGKKQS